MNKQQKKQVVAYCEQIHQKRNAVLAGLFILVIGCPLLTLMITQPVILLLNMMAYRFHGATVLLALHVIIVFNFYILPDFCALFVPGYLATTLISMLAPLSILIVTENSLLCAVYTVISVCNTIVMHVLYFNRVVVPAVSTLRETFASAIVLSSITVIVYSAMLLLFLRISWELGMRNVCSLHVHPCIHAHFSIFIHPPTHPTTFDVCIHRIHAIKC
jgi:hypothetical protein